MALSLQATVSDRTRRLRISAGMGQVELASRLGIANGAVSMLENGRYPIDKDLLGQLGQVFDCSESYFTALPVDAISTRPWLRAYADAPKKTIDRVVADSILAMEIAQLLSLRRLPDIIPLFQSDLGDDEAIENFAEEVRASAGLDHGDVVRNCIRATERLGCVVLPMEDELGRHLGLSMRIDGTPTIRVSRPSTDPDRLVPGDRQRFTVAHELGHLALHHNCPPPDTSAEAVRYEKQAHYFAGAFLAPADPLLADLKELGSRVTLSTLTQLKQRWGLAIKAIVIRLQNLDVIDADHARSLYKQISARKWNKIEPVSVSNEDARWMSKALASKFQSTDPLTTATKHSGLGRTYFERWCDWSATQAADQEADILSMRPRSGTSSRRGVPGSSTVSSLPIRKR